MLRRLLQKRSSLTRLGKHSYVLATQPTALPTPSNFAPVLSPPGVEKLNLTADVRSFSSALKEQEAEGEADETESVRDVAFFVKRMNRFLRTRSAERVEAVLDEMKAASIPLDSRPYTAVMKAYSRQKDVSKVESLYKELLENGVVPDKFVFNTYIYAFASSGDVEAAREIFRRMQDDYGIVPDPVAYRSLMSVYGRSKQLEQAKEVFKDIKERFTEPDLRNYNTLIDCYADSVDATTVETYLSECAELVKELEAVGLVPDAHTYMHRVKICGRGGLPQEALELLGEALEKNLSMKLSVYDTVITGMGQTTMTDEECLGTLLDLFKNVRAHSLKPSMQTYEHVMDLFALRGHVRKTFAFIDALNSANLGRGGSGYGARLRCVERLTESGEMTHAEAGMKLSELVGQLDRPGVSLSYPGFVSWLRICAMTQDLEKAFECWNAFASRGRNPSPDMVQIMVELTLNHDRATDAVGVLDVVEKKGLGLTHEMFTPILAHLVQNEDKELAEKLYMRMQRANVSPSAEMEQHLKALELV